MGLSLNLLSDPWIPVQCGGERRVIRPFQIAEPGITRLDWPRDDLNLAGLELLIGLVFLSDPPQDDADWRQRCDAPDPDRLRRALDPFVPFFEVCGEGPRFLQDLEPFERRAKDRDIRPPDLLFLDSAGRTTARNNADLMVRRDRYPSLSLPLAAMALYTLQAFAPAGGMGNLTSMRGGGPLVTLVRPAQAGSHPLWGRVWANVPEGQPVAADRAERALPWLRPTITSEGGEVVTGDMCHPAEAFFGMPRRLRLVFEARAVTGVVQRPYGNKYSGWEHPLSPYYRTRPGAEWLPRHPQPGRVSYRNWLGLAFGEGGDTRQLARSARRFHARTHVPHWEVEAGGWAMDKMKPLDFDLRVYPAFRLDSQAEARVSQLVEAATASANALGTALWRAVTFEGTSADIVREAFFAGTEPGFVRAAGALAAGEGNEVEEAWLAGLRRAALGAFDRHAVPALPDRDIAQAERVVGARRALLGAFVRPDGIRSALGLPVEAQGTESRNAHHGPGGVGAAWWHRTFGDDAGSGRAVRARLRRCLTPADALTVGAVRSLNRDFQETGHAVPADRLALIAIALAHVSESGSRPLAEVLGYRIPREGPRVLRETRWQALMRMTQPADLIAPLGRAISAVRYAPVHIGALTGDLHHWSEATRTKWCFQYFGAGSAAPDTVPEVPDA